MTATMHSPAPVAVQTTTRPAIDSRPDDRPRPIGGRTREDWSALIGAAAASLCLVWLVYERVLPLSGTLGFLACWYLTFIALYAGVTAMSQPWPIVLDRIVSALVQGAAAVVGFALCSTVVFVFMKGWPAYSRINFFTHDMAGVRPTAPLNQGGIEHAIIGSLIEVGIAVAISLPLGLITAVYLTEVGGRLARVVRTIIEAMTALPDLVAGLFIYAVLIVGLKGEKSGLAAALALAITMLPIIARSSEVVLRVVPGGLREASLALGSSQWRTVWGVVLPTARPGLGTALILGVARGIGETAPVLIASAETTFFTTDPGKPMNSLPLFIYQSLRSGEPAFITRGYGAASVLLAVVLVLFIFVRVLARQRGGSR